MNLKDLFDSFIEFLRHSKKTVLLIIVVAAITLILSTIISMLLTRIDNYSFPSLGTIRTTGVNASIQFIDWGTIYPGTLTNRSFYIQSESNVETILMLETANYTLLDPDDNNVTDSLPGDIDPSDALNVTWSSTGTRIGPPISPGEEIYVTLTMWASNDISFINYLIDNRVQEFSFDIRIYAKG